MVHSVEATVISVEWDAAASGAGFGPAHKVMLGFEVLEVFPLGTSEVSMNLGSSGFCITGEATADTLKCYAFGRPLVEAGGKVTLTIKSQS